MRRTLRGRLKNDVWQQIEVFNLYAHLCSLITFFTNAFFCLLKVICSLAEKCICQGKLIELLQGVDWEEAVQTAGGAEAAVTTGGGGGHPEGIKI